MRFPTREVFVGKVAIGGKNPIRIQSMTNVAASDVENTVGQIIELHEHGCEIVRLAVQNQKEARLLETIKNSLIQKKIDIPLVADIHFFPPAAIAAAEFVEKVRINPGNYIAEGRASSDYLTVLEEKLLQLIEKCRKHRTAIRLGVNHGSIAKRIQQRYANDEDRMIESLIEYAKIFKKYDFNELIFSIKASSAIKMISVNQQLVKRMKAEGFDYPIHLGVTEAGDIEDGIIKSACGIGLLLLEGIGDTIRVSLTEDPKMEIEPAKKIIAACQKIKNSLPPPTASAGPSCSFALYSRVEKKTDINHFTFKSFGIFVEDGSLLPDIEKQYKRKIFLYNPKARAFFDFQHQTKADFTFVDYRKGRDFFSRYFKSADFQMRRNSFLSFDEDTLPDPIEMTIEIAYLFASGLLCNAVVKKNEKVFSNILTIMRAFNLQNNSVEIVSCPGCGRTLYDHKKIVQKIKEKTKHLQNLKIAIMGCVVNGQGEVGEADFGCIGFGKGKVNVYAKSVCLAKDLPEELVADKILEHIKASPKWQGRIDTLDR